MLNDVFVHKHRSTTGRHQIFIFLSVFTHSCLVASKITRAKLTHINHKSEMAVAFCHLFNEDSTLWDIKTGFYNVAEKTEKIRI